MTCTRCGGDDFTQIKINLNQDDHIEFYSCHACESKWWAREGDTIKLDEVLHLTAEREAAIRKNATRPAGGRAFEHQRS